jgi:hypothetical protein
MTDSMLETVFLPFGDDETGGATVSVDMKIASELRDHATGDEGDVSKNNLTGQP